MQNILRSVALSVFVSLPFLISAQKVGIGTNSPTAKLHVEIHTGVSFPAFQVNQQGSSVPYLIIQPNGNVGISVANPTEALDVSGNIQFSGSLMPGGNSGVSGQVLVSQGLGNPPQWQYIGGTGGVAGICASPSINYLQKWTGSELCNSIIYDDGTKVGIGTMSPDQILSVSGGISWGSSVFSSVLKVDQGGAIELGGRNTTANPNSGGTPYIDFHYGNGMAQDYNVRIINDADKRLTFRVVNVGNVLSIDSASVGIGTANPQSILHIKKNFGSQGEAILRIEADADNTNENANPQLQFVQDGGATVLFFHFLDDSIYGASGNKFAIGFRSLGLNVDSLMLVIDGPNDNIGIGTANPLAKLHVIGASNPIGMFQTTATNNVNILELRHPSTRWIFHVDASGHPELGVYEASSSITNWNVLDIDPATGHIAMGGNALSNHRLRVLGSAFIKDSLRIDGDFRPAGNPGLPGQVLVSQGPGVPPQWQSLGNGKCTVFTGSISQSGGTGTRVLINANFTVSPGDSVFIHYINRYIPGGRDCRGVPPYGGYVTREVLINGSAYSFPHYIISGEQRIEEDLLVFPTGGTQNITVRYRYSCCNACSFGAVGLLMICKL